jgi:hypothetical protein
LRLAKCNGNQKWTFDNWAIKLVPRGQEGGNMCANGWSLTIPDGIVDIWDCQDSDKQKFGYDSNMQTIYEAKSASDASLCLDIAAGDLREGVYVEMYTCNNCWNQQWRLIDSKSSVEAMPEQTVQFPSGEPSAHQLLSEVCPPHPENNNRK